MLNLDLSTYLHRLAPHTCHASLSNLFYTFNRITNIVHRITRTVLSARTEDIMQRAATAIPSSARLGAAIRAYRAPAD